MLGQRPTGDMQMIPIRVCIIAEELRKSDRGCRSTLHTDAVIVRLRCMVHSRRRSQTSIGENFSFAERCNASLADAVEGFNNVIGDQALQNRPSMDVVG